VEADRLATDPHRSRLAALAAALAAAVRWVLAVPVGYLGLLTAAAAAATLTGRRRVPASPTTRFALMVPAHDEEEVIGDTLAAMAQLDYPAELHTVHVVADHCTDATVDIAREAGVAVYEHDGAERGKGPALQWLTGQLMAGTDPPDVLVVVDADTIVDRRFLAAIDEQVRAGATAVQGQYRVRDPGGSTGAGLRAAALALRHHTRPLGRTALGASCGLYGNGMAFAAPVLARRQWSDHLTEDIEFQMELLLDGQLVAYAPDAVVEAAMPPSLAGARTQNERWERGRIDLARRYVPRLARAATVTGGRTRIALVDGVLDHLVPPLSVLAAAVGGVAVAETVVSVGRGDSRWRAAWVNPLVLLFHVATGLVLARVPASVYRSLLHAPAMVAWKIGLWVRMLARPGSVDWIRTARSE
jgi:glycosyltransferase involved in cell wall biosynthesis